MKELQSYKEKLEALCAAIAGQGLDGFIVPRIDKYMGEFVAPHAERLAWLTGFTGSAGTAVILKDKACVFSDGRYTIQLNQQIDKSLYITEDNTKIPVSKWLADQAAPGAVIGYDPWLVTPAQLQAMQKILDEKSIELKAVDQNPLDMIWDSRPPAPAAPAEIFPEEIAGSSAAQKKETIAQILKEKNVLAAILNMPDSLAWLLNVRGGDIDTTPVILSIGVVYEGPRKTDWFVEPGRLPPTVRKAVANVAEVVSPGDIEKSIDTLARAAQAAGRPVGLDFARCPVWFLEKLRKAGAEVVDFKDPCILPRAIKTPTEQAAIRAAHVADGVAMVKFMLWLEAEGPKGKLSELKVEEALESFRREDPAYKGPSFSTIAGWGSNGAIVHYRATEQTSLTIKPPGLLLLDSGGQYHYGTTDITRTIAIGTPTPEMRRHYTLVLKGHIALARAKFPPGTTGAQIDEIARAPLKAEGLDYAHGTGHGVGCYLSVHEESAHISARGTEALQPGMLLSNEPGYYREGYYGIRIENLVLVTDAGGMLGFETVTLAPYDRALIDVSLLSADETAWIDQYHERVFCVLSLLLDGARCAALRAMTQPL